MADVSTSVNLSLPVVPNTQLSPELFNELMTVYNAIRSLALGLDDYTREGLLGAELQIKVAQNTAQFVALRKDITNLEEHLLSMLRVVNWEQPGELGSTTPNTVTATATTTETLKVTGASTLADVTTTKFGANGKAASTAVVLPAAATDAASTQALANAMRTLLINFGLGA